jgi:phage terminase large subunit-like protein
MRARPKETLGPQVAAWIETFCVHGPGDILGRPITLTDDEKRLLAWAYEIDQAGNRLVRRSLVGMSKGSRKTELAAWIALAEMAAPVRFAGRDDAGRPVGRRQHDPFVVVAASTYEQADLLFGAARSIVTEGPLKDFFEAFDRELLLKGEPGRLVRVPAVAGANDGLRPTFVAFDETHEWTGARQRVALVLENGLSKRADSWSLSITTAGNPRVESVALQQYEYAKKVEAAEIVDPAFLFMWREPTVNVDNLSDATVRGEALRHANPEPWKRLDDLERRFHEIPLHEWCRYHLNMWVEPDEERWLPPGVWDSLRAKAKTVEPGTEIVLGFDGSYSGDSTALVAATVEEHPHLFVLGLWEHPGGSARWEVPIDEVDAAVHQAFRTFKVKEMSADPPYWAQQLQGWAQAFGEEYVLAFNTGVRKRMAAACSSFYQAATTDGLTHDDHPGLARHVSNSTLRETAQGAFIVKEEKSSPKKIDAAIAAVIAWNRARWHYDNPKVEPKEWVWV